MSYSSLDALIGTVGQSEKAQASYLNIFRLPDCIFILNLTALEMVGPKKRLVAGTVVHMFFSAGYMLTALFAICIDNWRHLQLALTLPGLGFFCYWWFIPESARWLINQNRLPEAKRLIKIAAKENKIKIDDDTLDNLLVPENKTTNNQRQANVLDIFRHSNLRKRTFIILFDW